MNKFATSTPLVQALRGLLDGDADLQRQILRYADGIAPPFADALAEPSQQPKTPTMQRMLCEDQTDRPPCPNFRCGDCFQTRQHCRVASAALVIGDPLPTIQTHRLHFEMSLALNIFAVAQRNWAACDAVFHAPCAQLDDAASAAVQGWLCRYAQWHRGGGQTKAVSHEHDSLSFRDERIKDIGNAPSVSASPEAISAASQQWWAALCEGQVECHVRLLLLHMPSLYTSYTGLEGLAYARTPQRCLFPLALGSNADGTTSPTPPSNADRDIDMSAGGINSTLPLSEAQDQLPSVRLSEHVPCPRERRDVRAATTHLNPPSNKQARAGLSYPSDQFLEAPYTVFVVGVVNEVYFDSRTATAPAPWIALLLLLPNSTAAPARRLVNIAQLRPSVAAAVCVIGEVVEITGHTQVARRKPAGNAGGRSGAAGGGVGGDGDAVLEEYIVATWAAVTLRPEGGILGAEREVAPTANAEGRPLTTRTPHPIFSCANTDANVHAATPAAAHREGGWASRCLAPLNDDPIAATAIDEAELTAPEEEAAARAALTCWEGTRLALGLEPEKNHGKGEVEYVATPFFSASLDVVLAMQVCLLSAQSLMEDGVVVCVVDEAPAALVGQFLTQLASLAPAAVLEIPPSILCRAPPSFFLPSYQVHRAPLPPPSSTTRLARPSGGPAATAHTNDIHMPPPAPRALPSARVRGGVVTAPAPPIFPEVLKGGALTHAHGRVLALQGLETVPTATLKVLQVALPASGDAEGYADNPEEHGVEGRGSASSANVPSYTAVSISNAEAVHGSAEDARHVIQREGGLLVKYRVAHAALCSVRQGTQLTCKSHLFEFVQRCDVVLRPAYYRRRQIAVLEASLEPSFQQLLRDRRTRWASALTHVYALPLKGCTDQSIDMTAPPMLTESCSQLLSKYFIAAKARCVDGTDASMMQTLVRLTVTHAQWRTRLTHHVHASCGNGRHDPKATAAEACAAAATPPLTCRVTALIDAVAAIGLCDATLHFFTGQTLLGGCVFRLLEREAWPSWEREGASRLWDTTEAPGNSSESHCGVDGDDSWCAAQPRGTFMDTAFYTEVEFRTRVPPPPSPRSAFSVQQLMQDLLGHLEGTTQRAATAYPNVLDA